MSNPKVTFIIPVYNVEKYLRECLDSVVNQSLRDIQIICVNDGSTDSSPNILNAYAEIDQRITVINLSNSGLSIARNSAYSSVVGEYILFLDSDDFIDKSAAEKLYENARLHDADVVLFNIFYCNDKSVPYKIVRNGERQDIIMGGEQRKKLILDSRGTVCDKIYRSDLLLRNNIKFPERLFGEDQAVTFLSIALANKISIFPEAFYYYRMVAGSLSHSYNKNKRQTDAIHVYNFLRGELIRLGLFDEFGELFSLRKLKVFYRHFRRAIYLTEKERLNIFRENILEDDIENFHKHIDLFKKNEKRVLSCIIDNKPLPLLDKICDQLNRLTPFLDYCKHFLRSRFEL
ncbi:MAG: glycosyltransferase [Planctomycetaceae bacterium]|jgi:glycosyltransferase involved in cell wall biosynthesis|nr:glycosyltransferase [Planctomycetaceae bacterium]